MNIGLRLLQDNCNLSLILDNTPSVEVLNGKKNCNLFSSFSFIVQSILGLMSFMVLISKDLFINS
jgi:hypothetical protein